jgi:pseudaminic acid biosynthesis-associated methylase
MRQITDQEAFWQGEFGDEYVDRNDSPALIAANTALFVKALSRTARIDSLVEFGTNRGLNLLALRQILPHCRLTGIELNAKAHAAVSQLGIADVWHGSLFDYPVTEQVDLSLIKGVLIHLNPELLPAAYDKLYQASRRYILLAEYYNPTPVEVSYRGHTGKLFKRDFAGELLDRYTDLQLVDYGFCYQRDPVFPTGDANWFLLEKRAR